MAKTKVTIVLVALCLMQFIVSTLFQNSEKRIFELSRLLLRYLKIMKLINNNLNDRP